MGQAHETVQLRTEGLEWREVDGQVVVVDSQQSECFAVNRTGRLLWPQLEAGATRGELIETLTARFDVAEATAAADVDAFLAALAARGLLA
jgi:hypothetical protein